MEPTMRTARLAGFLYLLMATLAPFTLIYIPGKLRVPGNAAATAASIVASESLFRLSIVGGVVAAIVFLLLVMALYRLLGGVDQGHARLMVALVLVSVAVSFVDALTNIGALSLFRGAEFLSALDKPQRDALGVLFLHLHDQGDLVNEVLWGLWLFPFGLLVMRSRFLPRILGVLLIVNGVAYVAVSLTSLLLPTYGQVVFEASMPALLGELWIMLWLLIRGVKAPALTAS